LGAAGKRRLDGLAGGGRAAANIYVAMSGYTGAANKVQWCDLNPDGWKVVSYVFALQNEGLDG